MNVKIKTNSQEQYEKILSLIMALTDFRIPGYESATAKEWAKEYPFEGSFKYVWIKEDGIKTYSSNFEPLPDSPTPRYNLDNKEDFSKLVELLFYTKKKVVIEGVDNYQAIISEEGISVGCQKITFEKFAEIANAVEKFKKLT